ncbi:MAG: M20/M25/M40 family metallo-hydrolase [Planctomycetes bacterium]|nr:M20/M25/M40 family metallo-hydrolase [Planctomycetota bacterium]
MKTLVALLSVSFLVAPLALAQDPVDPAKAALDSITADELVEHIRFLASDELEGRDSGSEGERKAREYAAERFRALALAPAGEEGGWFQPFQIEGTTAHNVAALLEGADPARKDEVVVLGAHYDHVGLGFYGSTWGPAGSGKIHNGADDNASGTSAVLEIAEAFVEGKVRPGRSVLFLLFSGEERGLLGSQHFALHPTVDLPKVVAMVNLDMVGRGTGTGRFMVNGTRTSPGFPKLVRETNERFGYDLDELPFGFAPSDNTSFYRKEIPVLFLTTGSHPEYHNPDDDVELINGENCAATSRFAFELVRRIADAQKRPRFQWAELQPRSYLDALRWLADEALAPEAKPWLGVTLGGGLAVESVVPGSPAEKGGLTAGDVLVRIGDRELATGRDLRRAIEEKRPGDEVEIVVRRGGEERTLTVRLGEKP